MSNSNFYRSDQFSKILLITEISSAALVVITFFMQVFRIPGAPILFILSTTTLMMHLTFFFTASFSTFIRLKIGSYLVTLVGLLFLFQHWPGGKFCIILGLISLVSLVVVQLVKKLRGEENSLKMNSGELMLILQLALFASSGLFKNHWYNVEIRKAAFEISRSQDKIAQLRVAVSNTEAKNLLNALQKTRMALLEKAEEPVANEAGRLNPFMLERPEYPVDMSHVFFDFSPGNVGENGKKLNHTFSTYFHSVQKRLQESGMNAVEIEILTDQFEMRNCKMYENLPEFEGVAHYFIADDLVTALEKLYKMELSILRIESILANTEKNTNLK
jgi:hypothetical protein